MATDSEMARELDSAPDIGVLAAVETRINPPPPVVAAVMVADIVGPPDSEPPVIKKWSIQTDSLLPLAVPPELIPVRVPVHPATDIVLPLAIVVLTVDIPIPTI